ncbi:hypothetical protein ABEB36_015594, partial [Hypothenemus hampei]
AFLFQDDMFITNNLRIDITDKKYILMGWYRIIFLRTTLMYSDYNLCIVYIDEILPTTFNNPLPSIHKLVYARFEKRSIFGAEKVGRETNDNQRESDQVNMGDGAESHIQALGVAASSLKRYVALRCHAGRQYLCDYVVLDELHGFSHPNELTDHSKGLL